MYANTQRLIQEFLAAGIFPGVNYAFVGLDHVETHTFGCAQVVPVSEQLRPEMLFDVASLTKVVCTTTVILQLLEVGKIELDQPLHHYYPAFQDERVTIRQLLTHTSDINGYIPNRDQLSAEELRTAFHQLKSGTQIGQKVVYTDTGTILLGFLIEEIFGQDVQVVFQEQVLTPLGMTHSTFQPDIKQTTATEDHPRLGVLRGVVHDPKARQLGSHAGSAGLFTNLEDLVLFVQMYLRLGAVNGQQFLRPQTIQSLLHDQTKHELGRSLGWDLKYTEQRPLLFHTGYTGTFLVIDVLGQEGFVFLSNRVHPFDDRLGYIEKRDQLLATFLAEKSAERGKSAIMKPIESKGE